MSWTLQDEIVEAELLQLNLGKCEGQCQRENVPRVEYTPHRLDVDATYQLCGPCAVEDEEYWAERWAEYYRSVL